MSAEENKEKARRLYEEAFGGGKKDVEAAPDDQARAGRAVQTSP